MIRVVSILIKICLTDDNQVHRRTGVLTDTAWGMSEQDYWTFIGRLQF